MTRSALANIVGPEDWSGIDRGIAPGGPFDLEAAAAANIAVGNDPNAPILECALVVPSIRVERDGYASWFGADADLDWQFPVRQGQTIGGSRIRNGLRGYLAFGPKRGDVTNLDRHDRLRIETISGPHDVPLREIECEVTPKLDRVGIRLRPLQPLAIVPPADLPSCGMQCGTMQLHPDGSVVVMGPDHPVTGGYLQPMTVVSSERWKIAQLAPGDCVRFVAR